MLRSFLIAILLSIFFAAAPFQAAGQDSTVYFQKQILQSSGSQKIRFQLRLCIHLAELHDSSGLAQGRKALTASKKTNDPNVIVRTLTGFAHAHNELSLHKQALSLLKEAESYFSRDISDPVKASTYWRFGNTHHLLANYRLADFFLNKGIEIAQKLGSETLAADIQADLGTNFRYRGDYERATELNYQALRHFEAIGDSDRIVETRVALGIVDYLLQNTDNALALFQENLAYHKRKNDSIQLGFAHTLLALAYFQKRDFESSIAYSLESVSIRRKINDIAGIGESLNNLALPYMGMGEWEQAGKVLEESLEFLKKGNDLRQIPIVLGNIGDTKRRMGQYDAAMDYYQRALIQAKEKGLKQSIGNTYRKISRLYKEKGDYKSAYAYQLRSYSMKDSLFNEEKAKIISDLNLQYATEEKEREIETLIMESEIEDRRQMVLMIGLILVGILLVLAVVIFSLIVSRQRLRIRANELIHEQEKEILNAREKLTDAELRNTRNELDHNKDMLTSYMKNLLQKNALVEKLEAALENLSLQDAVADEERAAKLRILLDMKILTDDDWAVFKSHFEHVHEGLLHRLKDHFPALTISETRLFFLLKLNLSSKEISNILGVSPDTVKKSRYRLRKKLSMKEGEKLQKFIEAFN